jgi:hypothetical protein
MKKMIESVTGGYSSSARVVDGTLILSLPDAVTPVVWRMDMGHAKASAIEVRQNKDETFSLVLKTPRGDVNEIAPFATKAGAVRALMEISRAMESAHGQIRPSMALVPAGDQAAMPAPPPRATGGGKLVTGIIGAILLIGVVMMLLSAGSGPGGGSYTGAEIPAAADPEAANRPGVPVSADDFLRGR